MLIIREVFIAKPGMASKLVKLFKESMPEIQRMKYRVLTDLVADFNKVVIETEVDSLGEFERQMKEYRENPPAQSDMSKYTEMYLWGEREIYQIH